MNATLKDGKLTIVLDVFATPVESQSGKTLVIASTKGNQTTEIIVKGERVVIGVNAYIPKPR